MYDPPPLLRLPDELLNVVTCHISTPADTSAFAATCRRLRRVVNTSPVWKDHCLTTWQHWHHKHELSAKLARPLLQTDWRQLFLQRMENDLGAAWLFQALVSNQRHRLHRMNDVAEKGPDVQDLLSNLRDRTPEDADDVLARRWHADAIIGMIHRSGAVDVWLGFQQRDGTTFEEALWAFDLFVLGNGLGGFEAVERRFDSIAHSIREKNAHFDHKSVREKALLIAAYLSSEGLVGMPALLPDEGNYHALRNNFISLALLSSTHSSLPLQSVAIYCAVARRCGVTATPSNFPRHVHAVVQSPPDQTLDGQPKTETGPELLHIDVWQEPHQLYEDQLRLRLLQMGIPENQHDRHLGPADGRDTLIRAARNLLVSVNNARSQNGGDNTPPHEQRCAVPDPMTSRYAAFWAMSMLAGSDDVLAPRRQDFVEVLWEQFQHHFPEDFDLVLTCGLPNIEGLPEYDRMEDGIEEIEFEDSEERSPKLRSAALSEVQYRVGDYFQHRRYGYKGFIVGWDEKCDMSLQWMELMQVDNLRRGRHQPFYNTVAEDRSHRYVAEEHIQILREPPVEALLQHAGRYFKRWDDTDKKFVSNIRDQYPED